MIDFLNLLSRSLIGLLRSHTAREAEMAFLRQQLLVLKRSAPARVRPHAADRLIFVWLYQPFPSLLGAAVIFKPETLVRWHRSGFRLYWSWKSRRRVGLPAVPNNIRDLVRTMSRDNLLWGAPRGYGELPPSPGWRAFLRNHTAHTTGVDLSVVSTLGFRLSTGWSSCVWSGDGSSGRM